MYCWSDYLMRIIPNPCQSITGFSIGLVGKRKKNYVQLFQGWEMLCRPDSSCFHAREFQQFLINSSSGEILWSEAHDSAYIWDAFSACLESPSSKVYFLHIKEIIKKQKYHFICEVSAPTGVNHQSCKELEKVKQEMDENGSSMTDGAPLVKKKQNLKAEAGNCSGGQWNRCCGTHITTTRWC